MEITLKDVYQSQVGQAQKTDQVLSSLNITLLDIKNHLGRIDDRNLAADNIHSDHRTRIRTLEDNQLSQASINEYRRNAKNSLIIAIGSASAAVGCLLTLILRK